MTTATTNHLGDDVYALEFKLTVPGEYRFQAILTSPGGDVTFASVVHDVKVNPEFKTPRTMRYCDREDIGNVTGRWVSCQEDVLKMTGATSCSRMELEHRFDFDGHHEFHWLPYDCQMKTFSKQALKNCMKDNHYDSICFFGDSHTRERFYHNYYRLTEKECPECTKVHENRALAVGGGNKLRFYWDNFNQQFQDVFLRAKNYPASVSDCDVFVVNVGNWLAGKKWAQIFKTYDNAVQAVRNMRKLEVKSKMDKKPFIWISTVAKPKLLHIHFLMNKYMDTLVDELHEERVDAWQISAKRLYNSLDHSHFAANVKGVGNGGAVEFAITTILWNKLCAD